MKFAIFALLASASAIRLDAPPRQSTLMIGESFPKEAGPSSDADYEEIPASRSGAEERGGYTRVMPARFTEERDDRLMNSLIKNYAREVRREGHNTGHFFLNRDDARAAADEILRDHKSNITVEKVDFDGTWKHFDVNNDGLVEVERMPQFLRYLTGGALNDKL